jgi:hypothetical protein
MFQNLYFTKTLREKRKEYKREYLAISAISKDCNKNLNQDDVNISNKLRIKIKIKYKIVIIKIRSFKTKNERLTLLQSKK